MESVLVGKVPLSQAFQTSAASALDANIPFVAFWKAFHSVNTPDQLVAIESGTDPNLLHGYIVPLCRLYSIDRAKRHKIVEPLLVQQSRVGFGEGDDGCKHWSASSWDRVQIGKR
jgi:hypothetical protein